MRTSILNSIELCKSCRQPEYYGKFRWLNGDQLCRNCYQRAYEFANNSQYKWDDLKGSRPTMSEYAAQNNSRRVNEAKGGGVSWI